MATEWFVYIIRATDDSLYTGITTDPDRRFSEHATGKGARFFRGRKPAMIVFTEEGHDRSSASKREIEIKRLTREAKLNLISSSSITMKSSGILSSEGED